MKWQVAVDCSTRSKIKWFCLGLVLPRWLRKQGEARVTAGCSAGSLPMSFLIPIMGSGIFNWCARLKAGETRWSVKMEEPSKGSGRFFPRFSWFFGLWQRPEKFQFSKSVENGSFSRKSLLPGKGGRRVQLCLLLLAVAGLNMPYLISSGNFGLRSAASICLRAGAASRAGAHGRWYHAGCPSSVSSEELFVLHEMNYKCFASISREAELLLHCALDLQVGFMAY